MGKGTINSGGVNGLYNATLAHYLDRVTAEIASINTKDAALASSLSDIDLTISGHESAVQAAADALDVVIVKWMNGDYGELVTEGVPRDVPDEVLDAQGALISAVGELDAVRKLRGRVVADRLMLAKRKEQLEAIPADPSGSVWCADYTEDLSGAVGTIEIPGEGTTTVVIQPGHEGNAVYSGARDGQMQHREGMSPEQAFWNAAVLPGWQRFKPLHRVGTLTAVNLVENTGDVDLDATLSSAQGLSVNQTSSLSGVTFRYMTCNAGAFEVGDRVIVEFTGQDWASPLIIGFESNPKPCDDAITCALIGREFGTWRSLWFTFMPHSFQGGVVQASGEFPHVSPYDSVDNIGRYPFRGMTRKDRRPYQQDLRDGYDPVGFGGTPFFFDTDTLVAIDSHTGGGVFTDSVVFGTVFKTFAYGAATDRWHIVTDDGGFNWTVRQYDSADTTTAVATMNLSAVERITQVRAGGAGWALQLQYDEGGGAVSGSSMLMFNAAGTELADVRFPSTTQGFTDISVEDEGFVGLSWEGVDAYWYVYDTAGTQTARFLATIPPEMAGVEFDLPFKIARRGDRLFGMWYGVGTPGQEARRVYEYSIASESLVANVSNISNMSGFYDLIMDSSNEMG